MDRIDFQKVFEESLNEFIQLMKIPSVYDEASVSEEMPYGKYSYEALCFMKNKALKDGFEVLEYDNHAIAIRYLANEKKRIDVASHLDVVEPGMDGFMIHLELSLKMESCMVVAVKI